MAGTRASTRAAENGEGTKRKAEDGHSAGTTPKKGKTSGSQQTIEDSMSTSTKQDPESMEDGGKAENGHANGQEQDKDTEGEEKLDEKDQAKTEDSNDDQKGSRAEVAADQEPVASKDGGAIEESKDREQAQPSNILEKGVIYFFTRGRVGIDNIESVTDIQRSHFVLRPLPDGAKITDGAINDLKNNRLVAVPKKVWPKSPKDRFMAFVEAAQSSNKDLKENFFQGSEYETATVGTRQTPPGTPIGEGVYAITSTGNRGESHLVYHLTIPQELGQLQQDIGLSEKGSFLMSLKNPEVKGPANASLPQKPDFPKEFIDDFRGRSWMPAEPKHLDYANAQILLIGENLDSGHAVEATKSDEQDENKETPAEELEKLEHEDEIRIKHLKGDDSIYEDLGISHKDYPNVATTW